MLHEEDQMADAIDIMKEVVRRVIKEEPELIKDIIKDSLTVEVHHDLIKFGDEYELTTEIVVELDGHEFYSTKDTVTISMDE